MLSIIVVLHNMPAQAWNTLQSLRPEYQFSSAGGTNGALANDYEVIVVENRSANMLSPDKVAQLPTNFHYHLRDETGVSPAAAVNFGLQQASGDVIGLLIDGARMLTPGILRLLQDVQRGYDNALVTVPGYYLTAEGASADSGDVAAKPASDASTIEQDYLRQLGWQQNGYALFQQAVFSNGNRHGYLRPFMESTTFFVNRWALEDIGGADESFQLAGGGALILDMYRRLALKSKLEYIVLPGEGNFHQYHGGVSTQKSAERDARVQQFKQQLDERWPNGFKAVTREPILLGKISEAAMPFLEQSCDLASDRAQSFQRRDMPIWPDADQLGLYHGG